MTRRTVTVDSPNGQLEEITTSATTWAELKKEISRTGIPVDGMKGVTVGTKLTLEIDGASLPEGDFTVMLFTAKVKSGTIDTVEMMKDLKQGMMNVYDEIIDNLEEGQYGEEEETSTKAVKKTLSKERQAIRDEMEESL